jgi:high affinity Mn2+ porin
MLWDRPARLCLGALVVSLLISIKPSAADETDTSSDPRAAPAISQRQLTWDELSRQRDQSFAVTSAAPDQTAENKSAAPAPLWPPKPKGPTTFPQAFCQYLHCLRTHGLWNGTANGGQEPNSDQNSGGDGGSGDQSGVNQGVTNSLATVRTNPSSGGQGAAAGSAVGQSAADQGQPTGLGTIRATQYSGRQDPLGAERGGRSITIEGQPGSPSDVSAPATNTSQDLGSEMAGRSITIEGQSGPATGFNSEWFSAHAQGTVVDSIHDHFHAPYTGPLSLKRIEPHATSETSTFYFATRFWQGGDFVFDPEVAGGQGLSGANGIAGFPNGEITRVGVVEPTPYVARCFMRQTFGFGGEQEEVTGGINEVVGTRDVHRLTVAVGRFSATDVIDDNKFSHDPRTQFLAWSMMYNGAWDYPADVRGYTDGIAFDLDEGTWELHYVIAAVSSVANGEHLDPNFLKGHGQALEWVRHYEIRKRKGNLRLMTYLNDAHMGSYAEALAQMPVNPNVTLTQAYRTKYGFGMSWDQELTADLGVFCRLGWSDGQNETWMFTPIDRTVAFGFLTNGRRWCRPLDQSGLAFNVNGLSKVHREYLAAGGLDFNIGDGKLSYTPEMILEWFYNLGVTRNSLFSLDFQEVWDPAYNRARGPVTIAQGRFHIEF